MADGNEGSRGSDIPSGGMPGTGGTIRVITVGTGSGKSMLISRLFTEIADQRVRDTTLVVLDPQGEFRFAAGDPTPSDLRDFEGVAAATRGRLLTIVKHCLPSSSTAAAEDIVQAALIAVWQRWKRSGRPDNPAAYTATVAIRLARRYAREERRLRGNPPDGDVADDRSADEIDAVPLRIDLHRAIEALPLRQQAVLRLYLEGKSTEEIATQLKISPSTVAVQMHKARTTLRSRLRDSTEE
jgi:RNA polymerase sigma factor (sigma-70 family)